MTVERAEIQAVRERVSHKIETLVIKHTELSSKLEQLNTRSKSMTKEQLDILEQRLLSFADIDVALATQQEESAWMTQIVPTIFSKRDKLYRKIESKLLKSKELDEATDPTWATLSTEMRTELTKDHNEHLKAEFLKRFSSSAIKEQAAKFFDHYTRCMRTIAEQKTRLLAEGKTAERDALEVEINKQLKIVQSHVILALSAAKLDEKAVNLKLAGSILSAISYSLAGAGLGLAVGAVAGTAIPLVGNITLGAAGVIIGGIIGAEKGRHAYREVKALCQATLAAHFKDKPGDSSVVSINQAIASIKTREAFMWLMQGPHDADETRMIGKYQRETPIPNEDKVRKLKLQLEARFDDSRAAYFSMLQNLIRSSTADSAIPAAAGLPIDPPFDSFSGQDLVWQFTFMCNRQIKTIQSMSVLAEPSAATSHEAHIDVLANKELLIQAAFKLADNAESLVALAHQIALCSNLNTAVKKHLLQNIHNTLTNTIQTYDEITSKYPSLELQESLEEALIAGMFGDIKHLGHDEQSKIHISSKEHASYSAVLHYMKDTKFHHPELKFHQKELAKREESKTAKAADLADELLQIVVGPVTGAFLMSEVIAAPEMVNTHDIGSTGFSEIGIEAGGALAALALAAGIGAHYLHKKSAEKTAELCVFGDVAKRREKLKGNMSDAVKSAYLEEERMHTLIEAPTSALSIAEASDADVQLLFKRSIIESRKSGVTFRGDELSPDQDDSLVAELITSIGDVANKLIDHITDPFSPTIPGRRTLHKSIPDEQRRLDALYGHLMGQISTLDTLTPLYAITIVEEKKIIEFLREQQILLQHHMKEMPERDSVIHGYHVEKLRLLQDAIDSLHSKFSKHQEISDREPRNFKAIVMDSRNINDRLKEACDLIESKARAEQTDPVQSIELAKQIDDTTQSLRSIIQNYRGVTPDSTIMDLPEGTSTELAQQFKVAMESLASSGEGTIGAEAFSHLKEKSVITEEAIERLARKQLADEDEEDSDIMQPRM